MMIGQMPLRPHEQSVPVVTPVSSRDVFHSKPAQCLRCNLMRTTVKKMRRSWQCVLFCEPHRLTNQRKCAVIPGKTEGTFAPKQPCTEARTRNKIRLKFRTQQHKQTTSRNTEAARYRVGFTKLMRAKHGAQPLGTARADRTCCREPIMLMTVRLQRRVLATSGQTAQRRRTRTFKRMNHM